MKKLETKFVNMLKMFKWYVSYFPEKAPYSVHYFKIIQNNNNLLQITNTEMHNKFSCAVFCQGIKYPCLIQNYKKIYNLWHSLIISDLQV